MSRKIRNPSDPPNLKVQIQLLLDKIEQIASQFDKLSFKIGIILTLLGFILVGLKQVFPKQSFTEIFINLLTIILVSIHKSIPFHLPIGDFLAYLGVILLLPTVVLWFIKQVNQIGSTKSKSKEFRD